MSKEPFLIFQDPRNKKLNQSYMAQSTISKSGTQQPSSISYGDKGPRESSNLNPLVSGTGSQMPTYQPSYQPEP